MGEDKASTKAYNNWKEASEKFDYYVVGATGALCAWMVGTLPGKGDHWALLPQAVGLALIVVSTWAGYRRIECGIRIHSLTLDRILLEERLVARVVKARAELGAGGGYDPVPIDNQEKTLTSLRVAINHWKSRGARFYSIRDKALMGGFILYATGRAWAQFV